MNAKNAWKIDRTVSEIRYTFTNEKEFELFTLFYAFEIK